MDKFRNQPEWPQVRDQLRKAGLDPNRVAEIGEMEGDSLDHVELLMALEEGLGIEIKIDPKKYERVEK
jgi:acyl carrier protein